MNLLSTAFLLALLQAPTGPALQTQPAAHDLIELKQLRIQEFKKIQDEREVLRSSDPKAGAYPAQLVTDKVIRSLGLEDPKETDQVLRDALLYRFDEGGLTDFHPLDFKS